jgi:hypothetical protein
MGDLKPEEQMAEGRKLDAATCPPRQRRRQVEANLKDIAAKLISGTATSLGGFPLVKPPRQARGRGQREGGEPMPRNTLMSLRISPDSPS